MFVVLPSRSGEIEVSDTMEFDSTVTTTIILLLAAISVAGFDVYRTVSNFSKRKREFDLCYETHCQKHGKSIEPRPYKFDLPVSGDKWMVQFKGAAVTLTKFKDRPGDMPPSKFESIEKAMTFLVGSEMGNTGS
jgi:hypothetical protein